MKVRAFALALVLSVVGVNANAAIDAGTGASSNPETFLWVINTASDAGETLVVDLGVVDTSSDFSTSVDFSQFSSGATLEYGVISGTFDGGTTAFIDFTSTDDTSSLFGVTGVGVNELLGNLQSIATFVGTAPHNGGDASANNATFASGNSTATIPGLAYNGFLFDAGSSPVGNGAAVGTSMSFYTSVANPADGTVATSLVDAARTWTLSAAGNLTWEGSAPPIPLPAGVWLLGSALLGLVGVSRRKAA